ncbi:MAG TPA: hypothetical protein VF064_01975 [Pyrinomonadaceae bacterium]
MAEERNLSLARTTVDEADEEATDATKAELQRRMDEARESITHTVTEIKETVMNQYQQVRESISDSLDWREQYRRRPVPFTVGAFGVGLVLGYSIANAVKGDGAADDDDYDTDEAFDRIEQGFDRMQSQPVRAYAAQAITGAAGHALAAPAPRADVGPETRPAYAGGGYDAPASTTTAEEEEPQGPGLMARFKETRAYDRLQSELSTLGDRAIDELSKTAQTVVVPALLAKLKDLIGIDLSTQREVAQRSRLEHDTARAGAATAAAAEGQTPAQGAGTGTGGAASAQGAGGARS